MEIITTAGVLSGTIIPTEIDCSKLYGGLQINLPFKISSSCLKIEVQAFNDLKSPWLTEIYREYEGQLWTKFFSDKHVKFSCLFCKKVLSRFRTLRDHLNLHLEIYPFKCCVCEKKYASNSTLFNHRRRKHGNSDLSC